MTRVVSEGFLIGVLISLPMGPVTLLIVRRALAFGFWNATLFGSGSVSADLFYISLVYFGVAPLLAEWDWLRIVLLTLGALWLLWLGVDALRSARLPEGAEHGLGQAGLKRSYISGIGITLLNPLTIVGWLTLGGGYFALHPETQTLFGGLIALVSIIVGLMSHVIVLSALLAYGRRKLKPVFVRVVSAAAGLILLLIALSFLVSAAQGVIALATT